MSEKKSKSVETQALAEQFAKVQKSFEKMTKSNKKLEQEIERMKELMNYKPGSFKENSVSKKK